MFVHSLVRSLARTDGNFPLCFIGHRPLWVRCPKGEKGNERERERGERKKEERRKREREREKDRDRQTKTETERERDRERV